MQKIFFSLFLLAGMTAAAQKTVNDPNAEKRTVASFHAIKMESGIDLFLSQGEEAVAVSAADVSSRDKIRTEVTNGVLRIYMPYEGQAVRISFRSNKKLRAYVSYKTLESLSAGGGCDVVIDGTLKSAKLNLSVSGGSDFNGRIEAGNLQLSASGGSDVHMSGIATTLSIDASGGSDVKAFELAVENCDIEASGGSDISITANKELNVESSGGSDVHYKGSAVVKSARSSGGGSVKKVS
jgi:type 1 fimbria pilin